MSLIARIKEKISLRETARMLGIYGLPDRDGVKFPSPLRPDSHASCSIWRERLVDWSRDERFDAIDLYGVVKGVSPNVALHEMAKLLGLSNDDQPTGIARPFFLPGSKADAEALCEVRGFTMEGLRLARDRGILAFANVCTAHCWVVTDSERMLAQARRLDGRLFPSFESLAERKSHTIKGSKQGHVIGSGDIGGYDFLMLVEGGPDVIAAHCFIAMSGEAGKIGVLGILGAGHALPVSVAKACVGKRVRVFGHADVAGMEAANRWRLVLHAKGVRSDQFMFRPPISDLNDLLIHDPGRATVTKFERP